MEAPEKVYIPRLTRDGKLIHEWNDIPFKKFRFFFVKEIVENVEYTRTDVFIEKACEFIKNHYHKFSFWNTEEYELGFTTEKFIEEFKKAMKNETYS